MSYLPQIIEPKRNKVNVAQAALVKSESNLMKKQKRLSKVRYLLFGNVFDNSFTQMTRARFSVQCMLYQ